MPKIFLGNIGRFFLFWLYLLPLIIMKMDENDIINEIKQFGLSSYEICKDFDGYAESSEYYAWWFFPELIEYHQKIRQKSSIEKSINISIIINCAIVIEGFLYELTKQIIGVKIPDGTLEDRLHDELNRRLDKSSWNELVHLYKISTNSNLNELTDNENWKSITILFLFRNMLTHSKPVKFFINVIDGTPKMKHFEKYEIIYNFLIEKKLTKEVDFIKSMNTELINSAVADFFWKESKIFIKNIINSNNSFKHLPVYDDIENIQLFK